MIHWENHCSSTDPFTTAETTARENWYSVSGYPTVHIDGKYAVVGAGDCASAASQYRNDINARLNETGSVSPVNITGSQYIDGNQLYVSTTFTLVDNITNLTNLRATILVYEDGCIYQGRAWNGVTRKIYDQNITLAHQGDAVQVAPTINVNGAWNPDNLHIVAYLQQTSGNKQIIQGFRVPTIRDFQMASTNPVRSIPNGSGLAYYDAVLTNIGSASDTFTLQLGNPFGGWTADFSVCGDPSYHTAPVQIILAPNQACNVRVRVQTDAAKEIRNGTFRVTSAFSSRTQVNNLALFNGSYSVLMVDNDGSANSELPVVNALNTDGYLFNSYNVYTAGGIFPTARDMAGYDMVIWETSRRTTGILDDTAASALMSYMDAGGALFLTSQYYLNSISTGGNTFSHNYLGVASFTLDKQYTTLTGVTGDVIGDGMTLPLNFQYPSFRRGDDAVPGPTATTDLFANEDSHAMIRNTMTTGPKSVLMAEAFDAISETDADPNNTHVLLGRILDWLKPGLPMDVADGSSLIVSRIATIRPNPFNPRTEIKFAVSPQGAAGSVRLDIFDASGRYVANLVQGRLAPGGHAATWNGLSDGGSAAGSGVYFARLMTLEGATSQKMVLLK